MSYTLQDLADQNFTIDSYVKAHNPSPENARWIDRGWKFTEHDPDQYEEALINDFLVYLGIEPRNGAE